MNLNLFQWRSVKTKVTLLTLAIFVSGIWSLAFYASRMLRENLEHQSGDQQYSTVSFVGAEINHELEDRVKDLERVSRFIDQSMLSNPAALQQMLEQRPVFQDHFNGGILALSSDGTCLADVPVNAGRRGTNYSDNEADHIALTEGRSAISGPMMGRKLKQPVFNIAAPIRDANGKVIGALTGVINLAQPNFLDIVREHGYGKSGGYLVVDPKHQLFVTATDRTRVMQPIPAPGTNRLFDKRMQGFDGPEVAVSSLGVENLSSVARIPVTGWFVIAALPTEEAFAPIRDMQRHIVLATIVLTLLAGGLTWWMLRRQLAPMLATVKTLAALSDTNRVPQPLPIERQDEIGDLIGGFNRLLETLATREKLLRVREERFQLMFDRASDGIMLLTPSGKVVAANEAFARLHGYTTQEMQTLSLKDLDTPETQQLIPERMRRILSGEALSFEVEHYHKDGRIVQLEVSSSLIVSDGEPLIQCFHRDITERKRVERELQHKTELAQLLEQLARAANDAVSPEEAMMSCLERICQHGKWTLGRVATFKSGPSLYVQDYAQWFCTERARFESFMHYSEDAEIDISTGRLIGFVLREGSAVWLPDMTAIDGPGGNRMKRAVEAGLKTAFAFPVIVRGKVVAILEFFSTESRQPDALLIEGSGGLASQFARMIESDASNEAQAKLAAIVENSYDGIIGRALDGTITSWNAAAEHILGYTATEAIGSTLTEIFPPELRQDSAERRKLVLAGQAMAWETVRIAKDGRRVDVAVSVSPTRDKSGRVTGTAILLRDITERTRLEQVHLQAQKLESLGTLAGGIAHDFNNVLAAIRGNADLAAEDVGPNHIAAQSLEEIRKASTRASELVRRIMAFGRPREAKHEVVDLSAVTGEVLKLLRSTLPAGISLKQEFAEDTPQVYADAGQVHEAVVNLTTNAAHAIGPRAGSIGYRLEPVQVDEELAKKVPGLNPGRYARLTVKDSGCGMDAATLERIFDAFYTTKPQGEGTGLGLSMVHGIMRGHGGAVTVESMPGKGSSFHLYFPATAEPAVKEQDASAGAQRLPAAGRRVLYVDDEEALVLLAERFLSRMGHQISGFTDPEAALVAFRGHPQDYDVVVTDLSMPKVSGFELAREVLAVRPGIPVLMTTGYIRAEDEGIARNIGIRELIAKPTSMDELARVLDRLLRTSEPMVDPM